MARQKTDKAKTDTADTASDFNFEAALAELEQLVEQMEQGDVTLEESLQQFERGVALTRACQQALQAAEQKVQILLNNESGQTLADFDSDASDNNNNPDV